MNTRAFRYSAFAPFFISLLATSSLQSQQLPSPWRATARDYSSTVFESVVSVPNNQFGTFTVQTNRYVEVGACLNYLDPDGRWTESQDIIELAPDGGAQSVQRPTKIHFNSNLNTPDAVTLVTPNNVVLTGHVLAIAYYDAGSGNAVVLSWAKDCAGELLPPNQVIFRSAFSPLNADVRYTCTKEALESDVIFLEHPQSPATYGMNPATTRLEVWHEWTQGPQPSVTKRLLAQESDSALAAHMAEPTFTDDILDFDEQWFPTGAAYLVQGVSELASNVPATIRVHNLSEESGLAPVGKVFLTSGNRSFMVESMRFSDIKSNLTELPQALQPIQPSTLGSRLDLLTQIAAPPAASASDPSMQLATSEYRPKGLVCDYVTVTTGTDWMFNAGETYFVINGYFSGTVTVNPGSFIKYTNNSYLICYGTFVFNSTASNPAIMTSWSDDSVGTVLPSSQHCTCSAGITPIWYYFGSNPVNVNGVRIRWALNAIELDSNGCNSPAHSVQNATIELSQTGIRAQGCSVSINSSTLCSVTTPTYAKVPGCATFVGSFGSSAGCTPTSQASSAGWGGFNYTTTIIGSQYLNPPDPHGAVGKQGIVQTVNARIGYYSKTGALVWWATFDGFFSLGGASKGDPKAIYDAASDRFFVIIEEDIDSDYLGNNSQYYSWVNVAVSRNGNPAGQAGNFSPGDWYFYRFEITETHPVKENGNYVTHYFGGDYPGLSIDDQALYLSYNMFDMKPFRPQPTSGEKNLNCAIIILDKSLLINGTLRTQSPSDVRLVFTPLNSLDANGSPSAQDNSFSIQPARPIGGYPADGSTRTVFFAEVPDLGYNQVDSGHIRIWKISAPLNLPKLPTITQLNLNDGSSVRVALPVNTGGGQPSGGGAPQGNPAVLNLETVEGNRAINALWLPSSFGGTSGSISFCTTAGGTEGKAFWFHANVSNYPNVTVTDGPFDGTAGKWNYYPTMGANVCGDICVVYTQSSSTTGAYPHIRYVWRKAYEPDGYFHPFQVLKTSGSAITDFESGAYVNPRWGDFGTVTVDPIDGTFWLSHAYVHSSGDKDWGTWWIPVTIQ
jgi:hypothetical protein